MVMSLVRGHRCGQYGVRALLADAHPDALALLVLNAELRGIGDDPIPYTTAVEDHLTWERLTQGNCRDFYRRMEPSLSRRYATSREYARAVSHRIMYYRADKEVITGIKISHGLTSPRHENRHGDRRR